MGSKFNSNEPLTVLDHAVAAKMKRLFFERIGSEKSERENAYGWNCDK